MDDECRHLYIVVYYYTDCISLYLQQNPLREGMKGIFVELMAHGDELSHIISYYTLSQELKLTLSTLCVPVNPEGDWKELNCRIENEERAFCRIPQQSSVMAEEMKFHLHELTTVNRVALQANNKRLDSLSPQFILFASQIVGSRRKCLEFTG
jgi:hypothetical protein